MIIAILGGVGSGKSILATKYIVDSRMHCFCNYDISANNATRIRKDHIVEEVVVGQKPRGGDITEMKINWDYWQTQQTEKVKFHIFLDEVHNVVNSRMSMSKHNVMMVQWISQIRKILSQTEDTNIYLISQKLFRIDVGFRDLLHVVIGSQKFQTDILIPTLVQNGDKLVTKMLPATYFFQYFFTGEYCVEKYQAWSTSGTKSYDHRTQFIGNPYYQFYNSYEVLGESAYL